MLTVVSKTKVFHWAHQASTESMGSSYRLITVGLGARVWLVVRARAKAVARVVTWARARDGW